MTAYEHTQRSVPMLFLLLAAGLVPAATLFFGRAATMPFAPRLVLGLVVIVLGLSALVFTTLTIRVDAVVLSWQFGPGIVRKSVPLRTIVEAVPTTTSFWEGWGIHFTRRGWLYNVSGRDAVLVRLADGTTFMLGTDEPELLLRAIEQGRRGAT